MLDAPTLVPTRWSVSSWVATGSSFAFLFFVPWTEIGIRRIDPHDFARLAQLGVALVCALHLSIGPVALRFRLASLAVLGVFVLLTGMSIAAAPIVQAACREAALLFAVVGIGVTVATSLRAGNQAAVAKVAVASASAYAALVLLLWICAVIDSGPLLRFDIFLGYSNLRFFSHVQTVTLPILLIVASGACGRSAPARLALCVLAANIGLLIVAQGRATALGLCSGAFISLLLFRRAAVPLVSKLAVGLVFGALIYAALFIVWPYMARSSITDLGAERWVNLDSGRERWALWTLAVDDVRQSPWLGIGPMHYAHRVNPIAAHPHNAYLQIAAEWGVPMLLLITASMAWGFRGMARAIRALPESGDKSVGIGLFLGLIAVAVDAFLSGNVVMPVSQVWIAVLAGWAFAWTRAHRATPIEAPTVSIPAWLTRGLLAAFCASQLWLCWVSAHDQREASGNFILGSQPSVKGGQLNPRFWSYGWF